DTTLKYVIPGQTYTTTFLLNKKNFGPVLSEPKFFNKLLSFSHESLTQDKLAHSKFLLFRKQKAWDFPKLSIL
ncbi:TPA: hypothetical protein ACQOAS_001143, partial [Streptococcus pyogenes]